MIRIEILDSEVFVRSFEKGDRSYEFHKQDCYVHLGQKYPIRARIRVEPGKPYSPGVYTLAPSSFWVDRYGELRMNPRLVPVPVQKPAVA